MSSIDKMDDEIKYFNTVIKRLHKLKETKQLKLLIGAGNKNFADMNDYDRMVGNYDLVLTDDNENIDKDIQNLMSLNIDINDSEQINNLSDLLSNMFVKIIFDLSTTKFIDMFKSNILFEKLIAMLELNGKLYIDCKLYDGFPIFKDSIVNKPLISKEFFPYIIKINKNLDSINVTIKDTVKWLTKLLDLRFFKQKNFNCDVVYNHNLQFLQCLCPTCSIELKKDD